MRYDASEKLEIIRTVETSHLPVRRTLDKIGIPKTTLYAWLDRYGAGGFEALEDRKPRPKRVWNRIPTWRATMRRRDSKNESRVASDSSSYDWTGAKRWRPAPLRERALLPYLRGSISPG